MTAKNRRVEVVALSSRDSARIENAALESEYFSL
jgi:hypothetical protein